MATPRRSPRIAAKANVSGTPTIKMTISDNTPDAKINLPIPSEQDYKVNPNVKELIADNHAAHTELTQALNNIRSNVDKLVTITDDQHKIILQIVTEVSPAKVQQPHKNSYNPFKRFYLFITTPFCA
jgi:predicted acetyltransferase